MRDIDLCVVRGALQIDKNSRVVLVAGTCRERGEKK
jgi:hypothetical protein